MSYISFQDVRKEYQMGEVVIKAVDGVNFEVEKGEFAIIVGPSGAGKTTVLNMLGGMDRCTSGQILVDGARVSDYNARQLTGYRRHDIGFVFQFYNLVQNLTALENVELAAQICRDPMDAKEVLEHVGLGHRLGNFPAQLSGGEQQRVAIARALTAGSELVLADEPTGNLDETNAAAIVDILARLAHEENRCVIVVTHDPAVAQHADEVLRMSDGKIVESACET